MQVLQEKIEEICNIEDQIDYLLYECTDIEEYDKFLLIQELSVDKKILENEIDDILFESDSDEGYTLLQEVNIRRLDKKTQRNLRKQFIAIQLAKKNNDILYTKYKKGVDLRKKNKDAILRKYGAKAMQIVMSEKDGV